RVTEEQPASTRMSCRASRMRSRVFEVVTIDTVPSRRYCTGWTVGNSRSTSPIDRTSPPLPGAHQHRAALRTPYCSHHTAKMSSATSESGPTKAHGRTNTPPALAGPREWAALAVLVLPVLLISVDMTVLGFAVPALS